MSKKKPNIVILNPDQMRADSLHHMGNEASVTPNFDRMVEEDSISFENAFCQNPVCVPSRCSFLSGLYPHVRGHRTMYHMLKEDEPILFEELRNEGYYVWLSNRNDFLSADDDRMDRICDELFEPGFAAGKGLKRPTEENKFYSFYRGVLEESTPDSDSKAVDAAIKFIENYEEDKPFCVFLPLFFPHVPYIIEKRFYELIDKTKLRERIPNIEDWTLKPKILKGIFELQNIHGWTEEEFDECRAIYLAMCSRVDEEMGRVIAALKEKGVYDDTAIFMFSDHGDYTGDYGVVEKNQNTFEDCLVNVPLIVKPPKDYPVKPGKRQQLVELIDFYATVTDLCDLPNTHTHFGKTLTPIFNDENYEFRDAVFTEGGRLNGEVHCMDTGSGNSIKVENEYYPRLAQQVKEDGAHTKATMCRTKDYKYVLRAYEVDEFYDLKKDPRELHNLINEEEYKGIIMEHKERLLKWYQETCDVVPYKLDHRMSVKGIIASSGINVPAEVKEELIKKYEKVSINGNAIGEIFGVISKYR